MAARDLGAGALRRVTEIATTHARWVLAGWVLVAALCTLAVPRLEQVVAHDATPFLPASSPSIQAFGQMDKASAPAARSPSSSSPGPTSGTTRTQRPTTAR